MAVPRLAPPCALLCHPVAYLLVLGPNLAHSACLTAELSQFLAVLQRLWANLWDCAFNE